MRCPTEDGIAHQLGDAELRIRFVPEILHKLVDGENGHFSHLSPSNFEADAKIAFKFSLLSQSLQRLQVVEANGFARFKFNRRVIVQR
jgi:hypothetical protein